MEKKKRKIDDIEKLLLKIEAAEELGLIQKVRDVGWGGLTAEETGKIGGYMTKKFFSKKEQT